MQSKRQYALFVEGWKVIAYDSGLARMFKAERHRHIMALKERRLSLKRNAHACKI